ncbi:HIT family protein [Microvirga sp. W0021]|uniref:HIT family protein n=1 Tax=Hohaiivirga grylli TaxID=3133970 RepID=A0ABV0BHH0_9HYPH
MASYDDNNIFARIMRGELPSHKVYETDKVLAIMDLMPQADGHILVMPKSKARNIFDVEPAVLADLMKEVQYLAKAVKQAFNAEGVLIQQFNEPAAGQTVYHLHVHIIPRKEGSVMNGHGADMEKAEVLAANAEKIRQVLQG